jgi:hypothetical protein
MKRAKTIKRTLTYEERKSVAEEIKNGRMIKQVAAKWNINLTYAYLIFNEFLEWKAEWKHKIHNEEMANGK